MTVALWTDSVSLPCPGVKGVFTVLRGVFTVLSIYCHYWGLLQHHLVQLFCTNSELQSSWKRFSKSCPDYNVYNQYTLLNTLQTLTIQFTVLNLAQLSLPFFLLSFAQANHLFLAQALREVSECSSAGCAARDRHVLTALDLQKSLKQNITSVSAFIQSLEQLG